MSWDTYLVAKIKTFIHLIRSRKSDNIIKKEPAKDASPPTWLGNEQIKTDADEGN